MNKELETKKRELIEKVEGWTFRGEEGEAMQALIIKLLEGTSAEDVDFSQALEDGTAENIISLDLDCYNLADFVKWLSKNNFDLFNGYRFAETIEVADAVKEVEDMQEEPSYCYDFDLEEFNSLESQEDKENYIKDKFDGLLYSDRVLVIQW